MRFGFITGFLVVEGAASREECKALKKRANAIVEDFDPAAVSIFSTKNQVHLPSQISAAFTGMPQQTSLKIIKVFNAP